MQVADLNRKRKRKKTRNNGNSQRRLEKDPLQSFNDGDVNLDGLEGDEGGMDDVEMPDFGPGGDERGGKKHKVEGSNETKIFANTRDGTGKSTAGRNAWKEKHRKGKFSGKKRMSERRYKEPLGI
jgi:hypothetical protein